MTRENHEFRSADDERMSKAEAPIEEPFYRGDAETRRMEEMMNSKARMTRAKQVTSEE